MGRSKTWNTENEIFLTENWGVLDIETLAAHFLTTESAVTSRASILGLKLSNKKKNTRENFTVGNLVRFHDGSHWIIGKVIDVFEMGVRIQPSIETPFSKKFNFYVTGFNNVKKV